MALDALIDLIPSYARDLAQNLNALAEEATLSDQQKWGAFLACAHAVGAPSALGLIAAHAQGLLTPEAAAAARSASAIMGMNNIYYRSLHLLHNKDYETLPSKLRMNILRNPGVDKVDYELWCLAVSAIHGCGLCLDSHEHVLRAHGVEALQIQSALRIAAVTHAVAAVIRAESGLAIA